MALPREAHETNAINDLDIGLGQSALTVIQVLSDREPKPPDPKMRTADALAGAVGGKQTHKISDANFYQNEHPAASLNTAPRRHFFADSWQVERALFASSIGGAV